jgi:hypothetical protein
MWSGTRELAGGMIPAPDANPGGLPAWLLYEKAHLFTWGLLSLNQKFHRIETL